MPKYKLMQNLQVFNIRSQTILVSGLILHTCTVSVDGSGKSHKAVVVWHEDNNWHHSVKIIEGSTQLAELGAALHYLELFKEEPLNLVCDSKYVVKVQHVYLILNCSFFFF